MPEWPWNDNRLARRTRIANMYRDALYEHAPTAAHELDTLLDSYGQHWITGTRPPVNPDEPMTAKQIAEWHDTTIQNVTNRIAAHKIRPTEHRRNGRKTYRLTDFVGFLVTSL